MKSKNKTKDNRNCCFVKKIENKKRYYKNKAKLIVKN